MNDKHLDLLTLTSQLIQEVEFMEERFKKARALKKSGDFYQEVKPFADYIKEMNDLWKDEAVNWIKINHPKHLFPQQIDSAYEHIELISVQAFFPETSLTRFKQYVASTKYVLNHLVELLQKNEKKGPPKN